MPEGDPRGRPQCYKEQREEDLLETTYDAVMLLVQVLTQIIQLGSNSTLMLMASVASVMLMLQYLVPVLVMAYTNGMIAFTLWKKREIGEVNEKLVSKLC